MTTPTANYSFAFNGFLFGAGTPYPVLSVDGLESLPDMRVQDDNQGYNDGMFSGRDFLSGRTLTMEVLTLAGNGNSAQQNFDLLQTAMLPQQQGTTVLQFLLSQSDTLKRINVRVRKRDTRIDPEYTYGFIRSVWQFFAPDPRYYEDTLHTAPLAVGPPLGRTYNRVYNLTYGGGSQTVSTTVLNAGTWITYPTITVNGPITSPIFGNVTTGQYVTINTTITNTDSLVIDLAQRLVTLNGQPARNLVSGSSQWFGAPPGTSLFYMTGTNTIPGTTSATVSWRSAYI